MIRSYWKGMEGMEGMAKILLVEDNEMNRDMLERRLIRKGFEVLKAVDGEQGIKMAIEQLPHLILMDIGLPDLTGWDVTEYLKSRNDTCSIPIIALTAHATSADKKKSLESGCDEFETKPIRLPILLEKINGLLG
jgi:CheY-like chemotaxis protein